MSKDYTPIIQKKDLKDGAYYKGTCRNASEARWDAANNVFIHWRRKFGDIFLEGIKCPEDETRYDVFIAEQELAIPMKEIPLPKR